MPQSNADDLLTYFTDVEDLRELFSAYLVAAELPKRILVIHGVGGIGKSSLLRMFRLHCKSVGVPVALASGDEAKSVYAILEDWADDLKADDDVTLATFAKTRQHYRSLQAKAEDKALSGRPQGTPLRPIVPHCLERGEEGRRMLMALRDWWQSGVNDIGSPRPDTISPIPEGIPLLEAERIARETRDGRRLVAKDSHGAD